LRNKECLNIADAGSYKFFLASIIVGFRSSSRPAKFHLNNPQVGLSEAKPDNHLNH